MKNNNFFLKYFTIFTLIFSSVCFSQYSSKADSTDKTTSAIDSLAQSLSIFHQEKITDLEFALLINRTILYQSDLKLNFYNSSLISNDYYNFIFQNYNQFNPDQLGTNLLNNFKKKLEWQNKMDLGIIGKIISGAATATVFGLAAYHIHKYKSKAFFGK
ncbi:hypothetical protein ACFLS9_00290 [Bacteroidota bacterium]